MVLYCPSKIAQILTPLLMLGAIATIAFSPQKFGGTGASVFFFTMVILAGVIGYTSVGTVLNFDPQTRRMTAIRRIWLLPAGRPQAYSFQDIVALDYGEQGENTFLTIQFRDNRKHVCGATRSHFEELKGLVGWDRR